MCVRATVAQSLHICNRYTRTLLFLARAKLNSCVCAGVGAGSWQAEGENFRGSLLTPKKAQCLPGRWGPWGPGQARIREGEAAALGARDPAQGDPPPPQPRPPARAHCRCDGPISQSQDAEAGGQDLPGPGGPSAALPCWEPCSGLAFLGEPPSGTAELEAP